MTSSSAKEAASAASAAALDASAELIVARAGEHDSTLEEDVGDDLGGLEGLGGDESQTLAARLAHATQSYAVEHARDVGAANDGFPAEAAPPPPPPPPPSDNVLTREYEREKDRAITSWLVNSARDTGMSITSLMEFMYQVAPVDAMDSAMQLCIKPARKFYDDLPKDAAGIVLCNTDGHPAVGISVPHLLTTADGSRLAVHLAACLVLCYYPPWIYRTFFDFWNQKPSIEAVRLTAGALLLGPLFVASGGAAGAAAPHADSVSAIAAGIVAIDLCAFWINREPRAGANRHDLFVESDPRVRAAAVGVSAAAVRQAMAGGGAALLLANGASAVASARRESLLALPGAFRLNLSGLVLVRAIAIAKRHGVFDQISFFLVDVKSLFVLNGGGAWLVVERADAGAARMRVAGAVPRRLLATLLVTMWHMALPFGPGALVWLGRLRVFRGGQRGDGLSLAELQLVFMVARTVIMLAVGEIVAFCTGKAVPFAYEQAVMMNVQAKYAVRGLRAGRLSRHRVVRELVPQRLCSKVAFDISIDGVRALLRVTSIKAVPLADVRACQLRQRQPFVDDRDSALFFPCGLDGSAHARLAGWPSAGAGAGEHHAFAVQLLEERGLDPVRLAGGRGQTLVLYEAVSFALTPTGEATHFRLVASGPARLLAQLVGVSDVSGILRCAAGTQAFVGGTFVALRPLAPAVGAGVGAGAGAGAGAPCRRGASRARRRRASRRPTLCASLLGKKR